MTADNAKERWVGLLTLLFGQRESAPAPTVESTRQRIRRLYAQAQEEAILLPRPVEDDPVFAGMTFLDTELALQEAAKFLTAEEERESKRLGARLSQRKRRERTAELDGRDYILKPPRVAQGSKPCLCGCGQPAGLGSRYLPGHQAKVMHMLRRVERGEMPRELLPNGWLSELRWKRCKRPSCRGWIPTTDLMGLDMGDYGYDCLRLVRHPKGIL